MLTHPVLAGMVERVKELDDLDLEFRGDYVDIYLRGYNLFQIHFRPQKILLGSQSDSGFPKFWPKRSMAIEDVKRKDIDPAIEWVKKQRAAKNTEDERQFESKIVTDNYSLESQTIPLDRQIVHPGWKKERLDLVMYDVVSSRLVLGEAKLITNKEMNGDFFAQLLRYQGLLANNPGIQASYPHILEQKATLGIIDHDLVAIHADGPPLLLFLLSGFDPSKTTKGKIERVRTAAKRKRSEFRTLEVRVQHWANFTTEPCVIPSVSQLPLFEDWFSSNVPKKP